MNKLLSIILLSYNSGERIPRAYEKLSVLMNEEGIPFELIVMDDGSKDDSFEIASKLEKQNANVRSYQLSRNYGSIYSIFAGFKMSTGGVAVMIPDDEQQPYDTLVAMYRLWEKGHKVVIPYRIDRDDSFISSFFSNSYYRLMNSWSSIKYPKGGADVALLDREVIDIVNERIHPINTMFIAEVLNLGFNPYFLGYHRPIGLNKGKSRWTFRKKIKLAKDSLFSMSTFPLKIITYAGVFFFIISILLSILYIYIRIWGNDAFWGVSVPGWTSLLLVMLFFGGLVMLSMGVLSEYIWRIYDEVKNRPGYIIRKRKEE